MVGLAVGVFAILGSLAGAASWVDSRYETTAHATQQEQYDEQGRIELDLQVKQLKLAQLRAKSVHTQDDEDDIRYLIDAIALLRKRLEGLTK
jgi:hypothetical protein